MGSGTVATYDRTPGAVNDGSYTVLANGVSIAVDHAFDVAYARFAMSGPVGITVTASQTVSSWGISPRSYGIAGSAAGPALLFTMTNPGNLIVTVNGLEKLFILADPLESGAPSPSGPGVVNLRSYVSDNTGSTLQTAQFQNAINAAASQGAVLYVPDGAYLTGSLLMRPNSRMYLQSGARIQGSGNPGDYSGGALIRTSTSGNVRIFGRGIIDANGSTLRPAGAQHNILKLGTGTGVELDDVLLRDAASWTVHIAGTTHAVVRNVKVVNNLGLGAGIDGIDTDSATDVSISGAFVYTFDDCVPIKTTSTANHAADRITIQGTTCWTNKSALKIGTESYNAISNVTFSGDNVVHADRALAIYMGNGGNLSNVAYSGDFSETVGGDAKQRLVDFEVTAGVASGVTVTDYVAYSPSPKSSLVLGTASAPLSVSVTRMSVAGRHCASLADANMTVTYANVTFS
ncbi:MAG TPA: glycosyl hydrolase family 28 protein [Candidatus Dormibacteraeota bacterium]|nr:glycosyl hydrolase family 28 protein [Candidatus Dormibacteraeota bacterium]